jgi:mannose-6-phosphate isomerase-like protein (cupin superfamily)
MSRFETMHIPSAPFTIAPDGSDVRLLLGLPGGSMAHFELGSNTVSKAVVHKTIEEIWYFLSGRGQMWREQSELSTVADLFPGICLTIPVGTKFQFRSFGFEPLAAIGVTMPPWPGPSEAEIVEGPWKPG